MLTFQKMLFHLQLKQNFTIVNKKVTLLLKQLLLKMLLETKKIELLEAVIKVQNEGILLELESILTKEKKVKKKPSFSAHSLVGVWSKKDALLIENAIEDTCEQIHKDDWK
jgi:hypothetical protein